jgi:hypothetical protein
MMGNKEEFPDKLIEEIQRETDEELTHAAHPAREVERGTTTCRMTRVRKKMSLGMALP